MRHVKLLLPNEFIDQAAQAASQATKHIYVMSLVFADHPETHALIAELKAAAERGVKVVVAADIFTYGEVSGGFFPVRYYSHGGRNTNRMVKTLKKAGVEFHWLGRGRITLYHGRTHTKWVIIDGTVYSFGGINLYDGGIQNVDYMLRAHHEKLALRLVEQQIRIQKAERTSTNFPSVTYELDNYRVLLDGGIIGQSIIYRRIIELSEQATKIVFVSQYCPTGKLARILKTKDSTLYFNQPKQAHGMNRIAITVAKWMTGLKSSYRRPTYLHAKCMIFELEDGSKVAVSGSHNFAHAGVLLGTREVALETTDQSIIDELEHFIASEVQSDKLDKIY